MKYNVLLSDTARRQLKSLHAETQQRIKGALTELSEDPYHSRPRADIKKLVGPKREYYRLRIGNYRVIYVIKEKDILVAKILSRSKAYHWIE